MKNLTKCAFNVGLCLCGILSVSSFVGCGGGGTSNGLPGTCNATTYTPNYANASNLRHWNGFPLRVFLGEASQSTINLTLNGFDQWVSATGGRVDYVLVNNPDNADIVVSFDINNGGPQLGLTTISFSGSTIAKAEIEFFYVPANQPNAARINQVTAAHEFGHALGLSLHSPFATDLMAAETDGTNTQITTRDLNTLLTAYCDTFPQRLSTSSPVKLPEGKLETFTIGTTKK